MAQRVTGVVDVTVCPITTRTVSELVRARVRGPAASGWCPANEWRTPGRGASCEAAWRPRWGWGRVRAALPWCSPRSRSAWVPASVSALASARSPYRHIASCLATCYHPSVLPCLPPPRPPILISGQTAFALAYNIHATSLTTVSPHADGLQTRRAVPRRAIPNNSRSVVHALKDPSNALIGREPLLPLQRGAFAPSTRQESLLKPKDMRSDLRPDAGLRAQCGDRDHRGEHSAELECAGQGGASRVGQQRTIVAVEDVDCQVWVRGRELGDQLCRVGLVDPVPEPKAALVQRRNVVWLPGVSAGETVTLAGVSAHL